MIKRYWCLCLYICIAGYIQAQNHNIDLQDLAKWTAINRTVEAVTDDGKKAIRFSEAANEGFLILKGIEFSNGTIEFDVKGKNAVQQSFVGIAFHGVDEKTYDAVYFRPFNFKNEDIARQSRAVQYISMPVYPWEKLRENFPGKFENKVDPVPNPDGWFHVKLVVEGKKVAAYINNATQPSLQVEKLTDAATGGLALWVGNNSGGSFANLSITSSSPTNTVSRTSVSITNIQGYSESIYSEVLKEQREFRILLPPNYKPESQKKYDVVYILDGDGNLEIFSQVHAYAKGMGFVPDLILVGVHNVDRTRDFTPTVMKRNPTSGGADKFISFLKQELIPYVNKNYPAGGQNILYGHSLGGLLAIHAMFTEPALFSSYVAADPSLWYDNEGTNKLAVEKFKTASQPDQTLFISGTSGGLKRMGITTMDSILKISSPKGLTHKILVLENEHHGSVHLKTIYDGLKFIYEGYNLSGKNIEYHPANGIVLKNKPYVINVNTNYPDFRYTTDGTVPTSTSPKIEKVNSFSGPIQLTIRSFSNGRFEKTVTGNFTLEEPPAPVAKPKNFKPGGLSYSYYEGLWDSLPNFKTLKLTESGIAGKDFDFSKLPSKYNFALAYEGMLHIKKEGYYIFSAGADDGVKLYLKDKLLINDDRPHHTGRPGSFLIPLKKGFYPLRLEYFQRGGDARLHLKYLVPGEKEPIDFPWEQLYNDSIQ